MARLIPFGGTIPGAENVYNTSMIVSNCNLRSLVPGIIPTQQDSLFARGKHDRCAILLFVDAIRGNIVGLYVGMRIWLAIPRAFFEIHMEVIRVPGSIQRNEKPDPSLSIVSSDETVMDLPSRAVKLVDDASICSQSCCRVAIETLRLDPDLLLEFKRSTTVIIAFFSVLLLCGLHPTEVYLDSASGKGRDCLTSSFTRSSATDNRSMVQVSSCRDIGTQAAFDDPVTRGKPRDLFVSWYMAIELWWGTTSRVK
ncbi:hypothetical protein KCU89_g159, partial [Aureobasidium melanogenum]